MANATVPACAIEECNATGVHYFGTVEFETDDGNVERVEYWECEECADGDD